METLQGRLYGLHIAWYKHMLINTFIYRKIKDEPILL